jgi:hypothetical protein
MLSRRGGVLQSRGFVPVIVVSMTVGCAVQERQQSILGMQDW